MKPRIVRESVYAHPPLAILHESYKGPAWLAVFWPKVGTSPGECPYTPEQVMAACERAGESPVGAPVQYDDAWFIPYAFGCWTRLTPDFIGEPESTMKAEQESGLGVWELVHEARFWHGEFGGCTPDEELARKYLLRAAALLRSAPVGEHPGHLASALRLIRDVPIDALRSHLDELIARLDREPVGEPQFMREARGYIAQLDVGRVLSKLDVRMILTAACSCQWDGDDCVGPDRTCPIHRDPYTTEALAERRSGEPVGEPMCRVCQQATMETQYVCELCGHREPHPS